MMDLLAKIFSRNNWGSKDIAKERLRLVLIQDRATISPQLLEELKNELIKVISKFVEIDPNNTEINLTSDADSVALVTSVPVRQVYRGVS